MASDTLVVSMRLANPRLIICILAIAILAGCGAPGAPIPPSLILPKPVTDLRVVRKGDEVYLAWTVPSETTERRTVLSPGPTRICRSTGDTMKECGTPVAEIASSFAQTKESGKSATPQKITASYTDVLPTTLQIRATDQVTYAVEVLNDIHRSAGLSNLVHVPAAPVLSPPANFQGHIAAEGVVVSWLAISPPPDAVGLRYIYRVYRRQQGKAGDTVVGELPLDNSSPMQIFDHSFDWEGTYSYRAAVATIISQEGRPAQQVEGDSTAAVTVFAHDIFPPAVPSGLQAVFSGVGQEPFVDLVWAPDTEADLAGYNIFRHEEDSQPVKINTDLVQAPSYRDGNVVSGKTYFYSVSAADVRGNESARSDEANERVP